MSFTIENYKDANYKDFLTFEERTNLVSTAATVAKQLLDNGVCGATKYAFLNTLVGTCTDIDLSELTPDEKWSFLMNSGVIGIIEEHLGAPELKDLSRDFDISLNYLLSTNPDTKELIKALAEFIKNFGSNKRREADTEIITAFINAVQGKSNENKS